MKMSLVMRDNKLLKLTSKSVNNTIGLIGWFMTLVGWLASTELLLRKRYLTSGYFRKELQDFRKTDFIITLMEWVF